MTKLIGFDFVEKKVLIMNPLPPQVGQLYFVIKRQKSIIGHASVGFKMYIEKTPSVKYLVLVGEKKTFTINGYYQIKLDTEKSSISRTSDWCLGKLRAANSEKDKYVLYDNGESHENQKNIYDNVNLRREYGAFMFRYELCNVGNIRKMKVIMPNIITTKVESSINH